MKRFLEYLGKKDAINEAEVTWKDCENVTDFFKYALDQMARKEKEMADVKRNGTNGIKVKFKNGVVAQIVMDPSNKF